MWKYNKDFFVLIETMALLSIIHSEDKFAKNLIEMGANFLSLCSKWSKVDSHFLHLQCVSDINDDYAIFLSAQNCVSKIFHVFNDSASIVVSLLLFINKNGAQFSRAFVTLLSIKV